VLTFTHLKEFPSQFFEQSIKTLLCLLLVAILGTIAAGVAKAFFDLGHCYQSVLQNGNLQGNLKHILVDILTVLAMVEVFRTAMAYFVEGRVKVTYIIDTVLVAVLTEVLAFWYKDMDSSRMVMLIALVLTLMLVRIIAIRFSPKRHDLSDGL
jgi:uncharacterized membrane protein (DUF373 family)